MNNKYPKVSIIIPVYGVEPYIADCLESVISQSYKGDLECIIVNDCTPDKSMEIISARLKEYNGNIDFKIVNLKQNGGLSHARNVGMAESTGDYIYFLDSDDEVSKDCISVLVEPLHSQEYDMVIGNYITTGTSIKMPPLLLEDGAYYDEKILQSKMNGYWYQMAVNKLYRRKFLADNTLVFCEGLLHEDELWSTEVAFLLKSMYSVSHSNTYIYKVREGSITTQNAALKTKRVHNAYSKILKTFYEFILEHNLGFTFFANSILQQFAHMVVSTAEDDAERKNSYYECRNYMPAGLTLLCINNLNIRKQIRDFHLLFSKSLGYILYKNINLKFLSIKAASVKQ